MQTLVNSILSIFPKDNYKGLNFAIINDLIWVDKTKMLRFIQDHETNFHVVGINTKHLTKIIQNFENRKKDLNGSEPLTPAKSFKSNGLNGPKDAHVLPEAAPQQSNPLAGFMPFNGINGGRKVKTYKLAGDLSKLLGRYDRVCYTIALRGDKGAGKSRLLFQMVNAFANNKLKCAVVSCEMMINSSVVTGYRDQYLSPENREKVEVTGEALTYDELNQVCKHYDVVAIDSWTKLNRWAGLPQTDFDRLQKENPQTILIVVFQSTSGKVVRGGNRPEFDAGTVIHVHEGGRAMCEKNRYNATDVVYNVFKQKIESNEETE